MHSRATRAPFWPSPTTAGSCAASTATWSSAATARWSSARTSPRPPPPPDSRSLDLWMPWRASKDPKNGADSVAGMGETVEFASNGNTASGYFAAAASGSGPGVLVLQEWWGLVPQIKRVCDRLAAEGFSALTPDLY